MLLLSPVYICQTCVCVQVCKCASVRVKRRQPAQITLQGSQGHLLGKPNNKTEPSFYMFAGIQLKCD